MGLLAEELAGILPEGEELPAFDDATQSTGTGDYRTAYTGEAASDSDSDDSDGPKIDRDVNFIKVINTAPELVPRITRVIPEGTWSKRDHTEPVRVADLEAQRRRVMEELKRREEEAAEERARQEALMKEQTAGSEGGRRARWKFWTKKGKAEGKEEAQ